MPACPTVPHAPKRRSCRQLACDIQACLATVVPDKRTAELDMQGKCRDVIERWRVQCESGHTG